MNSSMETWASCHYRVIAKLIVGSGFGDCLCAKQINLEIDPEMVSCVISQY
jgi:hypothetical protein